MRAFACIMVIFLHITGPWLHKLRGVNHNVWGCLALAHTFTRFCVPVFIMISGALLLGRENNFMDFIKQKFMRILRPLLFWSIFYISIFFLYDLYTGIPITYHYLKNIILNSIVYGAAYHLWYLYLILSLYVFIPFISSFINKKSTSFLLIFILGWFMILTLAQYYETNTILHYSRLLIGYLGYLILGYALYTISIHRNWGIMLSLVLIILGCMGSFIPVYKYYTSMSVVLDKWFYYLNVNVVILSSGVFLFFKYVNFEFILFDKIAKHSFGIYFIHLFYIMVLNKFIVLHEFPLVAYLIILSVGVLSLSYFTILLLKKINFIRLYIE